MAKVLVVLPTQYLNGSVPLYRGDRWSLEAQVMDRIGGVDSPVDLTAASGVTGYFPAASGGVIPVVCVIVDAAQGRVRAVVSESVTPYVAVEADPVSWYVVASMTGGPTTCPTPDSPLVINDATFNP